MMQDALRENTGKVERWLAPLNAVSEGMGSKAYGVKTIGKGGAQLQAADTMPKGVIKDSGARHWYKPAAKEGKSYKVQNLSCSTCNICDLAGEKD